MTFYEKTWTILVATFVVSALVFGVFVSVQRTPDRDAPFYLEKHGYSRIDVIGEDPMNCPSRLRSTTFFAIKDGHPVRGTLCNSLFSDTAFVREF